MEASTGNGGFRPSNAQLSLDNMRIMLWLDNMTLNFGLHKPSLTRQNGAESRSFLAMSRLVDALLVFK